MKHPKSVADSIRSASDLSGIALLPFLPAGYPDLATTVKCIKALDHPGVGAIEIGFPFSDPIADGPVIQHAFNHALTHGLKTHQIFEAIGSIKVVTPPLVAMVSISIVTRYGTERFINDAKQAGFSGILIPDQPLPQARPTCDAIRAAGLDTVMLVAPTTTPGRRKLIADLSSGFIYYLSVSGITGERDALPADIVEQLQQLTSLATSPVCVGFGIGKRSQVEQLKGLASGAIVGSAIVNQMEEAATPAQIAQAVNKFCIDLMPTKSSHPEG